jgi:undecaprenyl phosphate-alpha-L-ara4N flippase subunit ArnE
MRAYGFLALAIALNMAGHVMFKLGATAAAEPLRVYLSPFTIVGLGAYGLSAIGYIAALRTMPLSIAMPSLVVGYLGTALLAHWIWGEAFGARQLAAFALIGLGLFLLHY